MTHEWTAIGVVLAGFVNASKERWIWQFHINLLEGFIQRMIILGTQPNMAALLHNRESFKGSKSVHELHLRHVKDFFASAAVQPGWAGGNEPHVSTAFPALAEHLACSAGLS